MEKEKYYIVFPGSHTEEMYGTSNEVAEYAESKANKFIMYDEDEYRKMKENEINSLIQEYKNEFGQLPPNSNLLDKMNNAGEGSIQEKSNDEPQNHHDPYKQCIIETINKLNDSGTEVFSQALNLAMSGENKDLNDKFEAGDVVKFNMEDLESVNDANVQKLVGLLNSIEETMNSLADLNGLSEEDLERNGD